MEFSSFSPNAVVPGREVELLASGKVFWFCFLVDLFCGTRGEPRAWC
jgi:hypothetical protein